MWRAEVDKVSHRPYSTGFWFGPPGQYTGDARYIRRWQVVAVVESCDGEGNAVLSLRNKFAAGDELELIGPGLDPLAFRVPRMTDLEGAPLREPRTPQMRFSMRLPRPAPARSILRACREHS